MYCQIESVQEGGDKSSESLLMGLRTLKVATTNFSEDNKLGEGGFGPVYKVLVIYDAYAIFSHFYLVDWMHCLYTPG